MARRRGFGPRHPPAAFIAMQLISQIMSSPDKPPVTLALIAFQSLLYFSPKTLKQLLRSNRIAIPSWLGNVRGACLQPGSVLKRHEWYRLISATFTHLSDIHLLYNMSSLFMKGQVLERHLGSTAFAGLVMLLGVLAHVIYLAFAWCMMQFGGRSDWMGSCVAGFSGVLFGMKAVLNSQEFASLGFARGSRILGIPVPQGQGHWAELVIAQVVTPNASFLGHLCGIVAGLLVVKGGKYTQFLWNVKNNERRTSTSSRGYSNFGSGVVGNEGLHRD